MRHFTFSAEARIDLLRIIANILNRIDCPDNLGVEIITRLDQELRKRVEAVERKN